MAIYKILIVNRKEKYSEWIFEDFKNEEEIILFKQANEIGGDKITICEKAEILCDILTQLCKWECSPVESYKIVYERFGEDLLMKEFPNERFDQELIERVEKMIDDYNEENYKYYLEHGLDDERSEYENYPENPEIEASLDEIRRWDEETDGSWRIANDFG
ncbi:MAG: hypothetical protein Q8T04_14270 [Bacteroidota bacterium]|nr:hypothetical protein [Bacteroidota bacterium]